MITKVRVNPQLHLVGATVLRTWAFLLTICPDGYKGTPGRLHQLMRDSGVRIGRQGMTDSLEALRTGDMIAIDRSGHYIAIDLIREEKAA